MRPSTGDAARLRGTEPVPASNSCCPDGIDSPGSSPFGAVRSYARYVCSCLGPVLNRDSARMSDVFELPDGWVACDGEGVLTERCGRGPDRAAVAAGPAWKAQARRSSGDQRDVDMLRIGAPWRACPAVYGPCTKVHNRFNRWNCRWSAAGSFVMRHGGFRRWRVRRMTVIVRAKGRSLAGSTCGARDECAALQRQDCCKLNVGRRSLDEVQTGKCEHIAQSNIVWPCRT